MKKGFIALVCASTFLVEQNALAAIVFKRFAHCGDGLVTVTFDAPATTTTTTPVVQIAPNFTG